MAQGTDPTESPFRYVHSDGVVSILGGLGASLLVTTYQAGKLAVIRTANGRLRMLPRTFDKAMGIAVDRERMAVATDWQIWTLRNSPQVAAKMGEQFDACYLPRTSHVTGSVDIHEIAWAKSPNGSHEDLWVVNTLFSCLCTLDPHYSFVPRWRPPFVTKITRQDRCHMNGLAVVDGRIKYVTVFGETDTPEGWRPNKAEGGRLIDIESGQTVASDLSMPHSPRWYDGRLWLLDSGRGRLCVVDLANGSLETVADLTGYTRGLAFCGRYAFVGLSKVRETAVFGGVPISDDRQQRRCGVSVVNIDSGQIVAFLEFEGRVEEIFDVQILEGVRFPAVVGFKKETIQRACVIAPEQAVPGLSTPRITADTGKLGTVTPLSSEFDVDDPALGPAREHNNRGLAQLKQGLLQEAATSFREAVSIAPNYAKAHGNLGNVLTELGELPEAVASCRQALKIDRLNTIAHNNLGNALRRQGHLQDAVASYRNALAIDGHYAMAHYNMATTLVELEKPDAAIKCFQRSLKAKANFVEAHVGLGSLLQSLNRLEDAESSFREALRLNPDESGTRVNLGNVLRGQGLLDNAEYKAHACEIFRRAGNIDEALAAGRAAVDQAPTSPGPLNNLGLALQDGGDLAEAEACFRRAIEATPQYVRAHHNLGIVLRLQDRLEEAALAIDDALGMKPNYPQALNTLGVIRKLQHRYEEAVACLQRALSLRPEYPSALLNLANVLSETGHDDQAQDRLRAALRLKPDYPEALHDLGAMHERHRRRADAVEAYDKALRLKPDSIEYLAAVANGRRHICDWREREGHVKRLLAAVDERTARGQASPIGPLASLRFPTSPEQRLAIAQQHARRVASQIEKSRIEAPKTDDTTVITDAATGTLRLHDRIRIGILSHEFGYNVVGHLTEGIYRRFDRKRFEILALDYSKDDGSAMRRRILGDCDRVVELLGLAPVECAKRIRKESVHILLDFNSYMPGGLPQIAALRPAPIQVAHMYPATTGADHIDYYLTDRIATPEGHDRFFTEQLAYLPNAYLPTNGDQPIGDQTPSRSECGLPKDGFVYCSFNNSDKIEPRIYDVWMRILKRVSKSVLWQREDEAAAQDNLRREADARGVDPNRLIFAPKISSTEQHLARHRCADLFLDTLTHGGHGTAADALWAGLPLITCPQDTFTSRVAASLVAAAGLGELIVDSIEDYENLAVELAETADKLQAVRERLERDRKTCALFDTDRYVCNLQRAFLAMWQVHASGRSASTFSVIETE